MRIKEFTTAILVGLVFIVTGHQGLTGAGARVAPFSSRLAMRVTANAIHQVTSMSAEAIANVLIIACFIIFSWALHRFTSANTVLPTFILVAFFPNKWIYDPATLALWAMMWVCVKEEKPKTLFVIYIVACFNKETAILMALVTKDNRLRGAMVTVWLVSRVTVAVTVGSSLPALCLSSHAEFIAFSFPAGLIAYTGSVWMVGMLLLGGYLEWPPILYRAKLPFTILIVTYLLFGMPLEWRVFYEMYLPIVAMVHLTLKGARAR